MDVVYRCCCGLDVHKDSVTACVLWAEGGGKSRPEKRKFATFTRQLLELSCWLEQCGVTHVVMESTGVYWKPVWHVLEGHFAVVEHLRCPRPLPFIQCPFQTALLVTTANVPYGLGSELDQPGNLRSTGASRPLQQSQRTQDNPNLLHTTP